LKGKKIITRNGKVALQVLIPKTLYEDLIKIAVEEYGYVRGAVSKLVERALKTYLNFEKHVKMPVNSSNKIQPIYERIVERVKKLYGVEFKPYQVPTKLFEKAIAVERGSDPRTIRKWIKIFEKFNLIRRVDQHGRVIQLK